jgi:superfamily I DNA/RNA helicase
MWGSCRARDLLRREASVRGSLHQRYQRVLLDEFQDTDPIQIELAVRIAADAPGDQPRWEDIAVPAGRLFVIGDPKQSIAVNPTELQCPAPFATVISDSRPRTGGTVWSTP